MDRRRFIGTGTASAIGLAGASACLPGVRLSADRPAAMPADMDEYLARLDAGMARIGRWSTADVVPLWTGDRAEADAMARTAFQSLFITGMIADLPIEAQLRPEVQRRIHSAVPLMDEGIERTTAFLTSRTAADLAYVQLGLRDYGAGADIINAIDREAEASGLSSWRRAQTREIFAQAEFRLGHQPPALIIGEYVDKVEKLAAADIVAESQMRSFAAKAGEEAFWQASQKTLRQVRLSRGRRAMGYGLLVFAVGGAIVAGGAFPGVFVMTAGAVMMIVGLIILLIGAGTPADKPR